ncbi:PREDICTED: homeobox-leucine zipper protein HDG8 [Tarenaya hassleriana]|uniref:homeobox-leucine zipper protein HDG8 n=1 Tax=Tarenaya hassleriana TaxID=28532 RepID=UPI00053C7362|nr:PREDICTED: homeobox-leucine zipper protein HDG8 [Tarenaya hassleriana]
MDSGGRDGASSEEPGASSNSVSKKNKTNYHRHTTQQIQRLEAYFKECPHPDEHQRCQLGKELDLEPKQIKFWFQNKRTQTKAQNERADNTLLRTENERIHCENHAIKEALRNVICPACGGPPFGQEERDHSLQKLRLENAHLKEQLEKVSDLLSKYIGKPISVMDSRASSSSHEPLPPSLAHQIPPNFSYGSSSNNPEPSDNHRRHHLLPHLHHHPHVFSDPINNNNSNSAQIPAAPVQVQQALSDLEKVMMSETAAGAIEELVRLFHIDEPLWIKSSIDGRVVVDQEHYENFSQRHTHFKTSSARVESSKEVAVVPIEARSLVDMFLDSEKWVQLFPTIVNRAKTIHLLESAGPMEQVGSVQLMYEQMHILSPLVPPREFLIVRSCQLAEEGMWVVADVSYYLRDFDFVSSSNCWKRPSGCIIQDLSDGHSKVTWIEHVEVDDKAHTHRLYRDLLCGGSGYGARRWIVTLERTSHRFALSNLNNIPTTDFGAVISSGEGRKSMMKLGQRMLKNFTGMLSMSGKLDFPQLSEVNNSGVRVSVRKSMEAGQPSGVIVSAASSLWLPLPPSKVFNFFRDVHLRHQWDVLCHGNAVAEVGRILCGPDENNCVTVLRPFIPTESGMLMLQESFMDSLGGMMVYAPIDIPTMHVAVNGDDPSAVPILPSGFIISRDGRSSPVTVEGSTLLTVAFQILVSGPTYSRDLNMESVATVNTLISSTIQRVKAMLNCVDLE